MNSTHLAKILASAMAVTSLLAISPESFAATPRLSETKVKAERVLPSPTLKPGIWQESHLRSVLGQVSSSSRMNGWQPLNLGIETSNSSVPVFAMGSHGTTYLANSVGVWRRSPHAWQLMSPIPGDGMRYATAMAVSPSGVPYLATTSSNCVWMWTKRGWHCISDGPISNVRFLSWTPQGQLLVGTNVFPKTSSNHMGPAPTPALGLFEYARGKWKDLSSLYSGKDSRFVRNIAWSPDGKLALSLDNNISIKTWYGWRTVSSDTVNDIRWWHGELIAATNHGLQAYDGGRWHGLPGMPASLANALVTNLNEMGNELLVQAQSPKDNSIFVYLDKAGVWSQLPYRAIGVRYVGVSPQHVPVIETEGSTPSIQLWQLNSAVWQQLRLPRAATEYVNSMNYIEIQQYFPENVAWSPNADLTVSTEQHGVWQWNGTRFVMLGGSIDRRHVYSTGDIHFLQNGTLVANVKEIIPPPPKTPAMLHNMTWLYRNGHWAHLQYPAGITENLVQGISVSPQGDILLFDQHPGTQMWIYHHNQWNLAMDKTSFPIISTSNYRVSFAPNGSPTLSVAGYGDASSNGLYEYHAGRWKQMLQNPSWLRKKNTYWFYSVWLPDTSMVFSVMNDSGYHLWRYTNGKWSDLGLNNQRIERMFVLPGGWLCAISDAYVCWVKKL